MTPIGLPTAANWNPPGALPWGNSSGGGVGRNDPGAVAADYRGAYNDALAMNQSLYNNIFQGYQQAVSAQTTAQQAIQAGYSNLYNQVIDRVSGVGKAREANINDSAAQLLARETQGNVDKGLGNSTIANSLARGVEGDRQRRLMENDDQTNRLVGEYMSNLGLAGLRSAEGGIDDTTNLSEHERQWMNSVQAKYPDAGLFAELARTAGAEKGSGAGGGMFGGGSFAGSPAPRVGYVPGGGPYGGAGGGGLMATAGGGSLMGGVAAAATSPYAVGNVWDASMADRLSGTGSGIYDAPSGTPYTPMPWEPRSGDYGGGGDF